MSNPFDALGGSALAALRRALEEHAKVAESKIVRLATHDLGVSRDPQATMLTLARLGGERDALDRLKTLVYDAERGGTNGSR